MTKHDDRKRMNAGKNNKTHVDDAFRWIKGSNQTNNPRTLQGFRLRRVGGG